MRFLVFGAGSIGSAFGGFLSTKHDVILLGRKWHIDPIRRRGLEVSGIWGHHCFRRFAGLYDSEHRLIEERPETDYILLTTKANDTGHAAEAIAAIAGPETLVVSLQNGLGNIECLRRHFPDENILAGRVIFGVVLGRGSIDVTVSADDTLIGEVGKRRGLSKARRLVSVFEECGLKARAVRDIDRHIWSKVIYNCALNPLASLLDVPYGELLDSEETRELMRKIVEEIYAVAGRMKIKLSPPTPRGYTRLLFRTLIPLTAAHHPSMLQAIKKSKPTEIAALNAAIVDYGRAVNIVTPVNSLVSALIRAKERLSGCISP
jgi:2-dehydropantoate 2-reductase